MARFDGIEPNEVVHAQDGNAMPILLATRDGDGVRVSMSSPVGISSWWFPDREFREIAARFKEAADAA